MIYFCINSAHGPTRPWPDQSYVACYGPDVRACEENRGALHRKEGDVNENTREKEEMKT